MLKSTQQPPDTQNKRNTRQNDLDNSSTISTPARDGSGQQPVLSTCQQAHHTCPQPSCTLPGHQALQVRLAIQPPAAAAVAESAAVPSSRSIWTCSCCRMQGGPAAGGQSPGAAAAEQQAQH
jgi:hypothetical protein